MKEEDYEDIAYVMNKFYIKAINKYKDQIEELKGINEEHKDQIEELEGINEILEEDNDNLTADCQVYEEEWHNAEFELQCVKDELEEEKNQNKEIVEDEEVDTLIADLIEEKEDCEDEISELEEYIEYLEDLVDVHRDVLSNQSYIIAAQHNRIKELTNMGQRIAWFMDV